MDARPDPAGMSDADLMAERQAIKVETFTWRYCVPEAGWPPDVRDAWERFKAIDAEAMERKRARVAAAGEKSDGT